MQATVVRLILPLVQLFSYQRDSECSISLADKQWPQVLLLLRQQQYRLQKKYEQRAHCTFFLKGLLYWRILRLAASDREAKTGKEVLPAEIAVEYSTMPTEDYTK